MTSAPPTIVAVITGERGQREIVRPLAAVGVECVVLDWEVFRVSGRSPRLRFIPALWRIVRTHRGAIVFTDMSSAFLAVILACAKLHGSSVLLRLRGDPHAEIRDQLRFHWTQREWPQFLRAVVAALLDRPLFSLVDHFVPVSDWIVRRLGIAERASIARVPVTVAAFPPREHSSAIPLRLLAVTNFNYPQKIAAMGRFLETYRAFLVANGLGVTIAGTGIAWSAFRTRYESCAEFSGFVSDVASLYAQHDVFVHFSDLDAFPYVVLEAQAAGLPVIVNRACGMLEQVEDGVNGFLVDLEDRAAVEALLLRIRDSISLRTQLGVQARQSVQARYSLEAIGRELRSILSAAS